MVGTTEPQRAMKGVGIVRFCVPVQVDDVGGERAFRRAALALYRIPEGDDGDDVYIAADENLPFDRRPAVTTARLDDFDYLGEAAVQLHELQLVAHGGVTSRASSRIQFALAKGRARGANPTPVDPSNAAAAGAAIEALVAPPAHWPRPPPAAAGRFIADVVVTFAPRAVPAPIELVYVRLLRWVGDGFQPVYSTLITSSEVPTRPEPVGSAPSGRYSARAPRWKVRVPTMHVPVACLHGGGGGDRVDTAVDASQSAGTKYLPREDTAWRLEVVARVRTGHDVLLGWVDTSLAALNDAGRRASKETPVALECDLAPGESDFECATIDEARGEYPPTIHLDRWKLKRGSGAVAVAREEKARAARAAEEMAADDEFSFRHIRRDADVESLPDAPGNDAPGARDVGEASSRPKPKGANDKTLGGYRQDDEGHFAAGEEEFEEERALVEAAKARAVEAASSGRKTREASRPALPQRAWSSSVRAPELKPAISMLQQSKAKAKSKSVRPSTAKAKAPPSATAARGDRKDRPKSAAPHAGLLTRGETRRASQRAARAQSHALGYGSWTSEPTGPRLRGGDEDAQFLQELMKDETMAPVMAGMESHVRQTLATVDAASKAIAEVDGRVKGGEEKERVGTKGTRRIASGGRNAKSSVGAGEGSSAGRGGGDGGMGGGSFSFADDDWGDDDDALSVSDGELAGGSSVPHFAPSEADSEPVSSLPPSSIGSPRRGKRTGLASRATPPYVPVHTTPPRQVRGLLGEPPLSASSAGTSRTDDDAERGLNILQNDDATSPTAVPGTATTPFSSSPTHGPAATSRALTRDAQPGGGDLSESQSSFAGPMPTTTPERTRRRVVKQKPFEPSAELIAATDASVREAIVQKLESYTKRELIDMAMKIREELLVTFRGQERWLEQRMRREARAAAGVYGASGQASSASLFGGLSSSSVGKGKGPLWASASEGTLRGGTWGRSKR